MLKQSCFQPWRQARLRISPARCFVLSPGRRQCPAHDKPPGEQEPLENQLQFPDAPTTRHSDLASFLDHTRRTGLDEKSTVYVGTHYEYTVADALSRHGFFLKRIGGASDYGTDLIGTWTLPSLDHPMRVLLQCKAGVQRVGPQHVRELEGAFIGAPVGWRGDGVLGVLVSERAATKGVRDSLCRSRWPMAFACCSRTGALTQMLWNRRAEEQGLEGFGVTVKHAQDQAPELVLTRDGKVVA
ncbi:restriction endonuclease [Hirsutella rhossiliensis]|uniref:Restriction endonuclease domain-containing protein n=1 Tax=Hirsutella rhossiliensis TaxID=111463 RepID=A0A9P8N2Y4_9HYPO|nr:restriction endonuclease domain-containing protein [Hirsutella rhossiliensis]KAH0965874.1 restriction endonuclease domain-containing protein [Hirsutella rhossiliensis]